MVTPFVSKINTNSIKIVIYQLRFISFFNLFSRTLIMSREQKIPNYDGPQRFLPGLNHASDTYFQSQDGKEKSKHVSSVIKQGFLSNIELTMFI